MSEKTMSLNKILPPMAIVKNLLSVLRVEDNKYTSINLPEGTVELEKTDTNIVVRYQKYDTNDEVSTYECTVPNNPGATRGINSRLFSSGIIQNKPYLVFSILSSNKSSLNVDKESARFI